MSKYIDANKAKNGVMDFVNEYGEITGMFITDFNILLERSAADVQEVKHGRWVQNPDYREWDYCSVCRIGTKRREYGLNDNGTEWVTEANYPYCPNCGSRMDLGEVTE